MCHAILLTACEQDQTDPARKLSANHASSLREILKGLCFLIVCGLDTLTKRRFRPDLCCCVTAENNNYVMWPANKNVGLYVSGSAQT